MLRGPQFNKKKLLRVAIYKKGLQNKLNLIKIYNGPHVWDPWSTECFKILQAEESPVVVVDVDIRGGVDEEHDPGLQSAVEVAKARHRLVRKVNLVLMSFAILKK